MQVRGKAMSGKAGDLLDITRDILTTARLDDKERFKQVRLACHQVLVSTPPWLGPVGWCAWK
jgi:hypothetical protein